MIEQVEKQVASISGGRTSHFMISVLLEKYGKNNVDFVYCDTGAEHEGTYTFIKDTAKHFGIDITCIKLYMPKEAGVGARYEIVPVGNLEKDYKAFRSLMEKYGRPFNPGGKFCTDQMKTQIYRKYCNETYGKGNYTTWIGYRDEPKDASRSWGHSLSVSLNKHLGVHQRDQGEFYKTCREHFLKEGGVSLRDMLLATRLTENKDQLIDKMVSRVSKNIELGYRFLFEISDYDKTDILKYWEDQEIDLDIPEHTGNCVFCIEKTVNQLSYLCHTQPKIAQEWIIELENPEIPDKGRKLGEDIMYRNGSRKMSFNEVYNEALEQPLEFWESKVTMEKKLSPCAAGSCELFNDEE